MHDLWMWSWLAAMITGVIVWGLIFYACDPLPPPQRDRDPGADALQPADRDLLHDRADHDGDRLLLLHRRRPEQGPARDDPDPDQTVTVVGQQWSWTFNYNLGYDETAKPTSRSTARRSSTRAAPPPTGPTLWLVKDQSVKFNLYSPDVIHSFWVPAFLFKMDVVPGRDNHFTLTPDPRGHLRGPLRRALRRLPLADALQRQGRRAGGVRRPPRRARRPGQHRPGDRRLVRRREGRPRTSDETGGEE